MLNNYERQALCELRFNESAPFWHLYTPGEQTEIIFIDKEHFAFGMTLASICKARFPNVSIYAFELMSNHVHFILSGGESVCRSFFEFFCSKMKLFFSRRGRVVDLSDFNKYVILPIENLFSIQNEIVYTHRNGYLVHPECTPFSYYWGTGMYYFNPLVAFLPLRKFIELSYDQKRGMCHSRTIDLPDSYLVFDNYISPISFCEIQSGMQLFIDAHQFFQLISRNSEANSEIAKRIGDRVFVTDDEMYDIVRTICRKDYDVVTPLHLAADSKIEVAKIMRFKYNASKKQIKRILKLGYSILDELFGPDV